MRKTSDEKFVEYDEKFIEEVRQKLYDVIPKKYFQEKFGKRTPNYIKLLLVRETTGYLIIRSTEPDEVISTEIGDKEVVVIPSRKLKAREKLTGLLFCRKFGVVHPDLEYNFLKARLHLANPNSIVFGDSVTVERREEAIGLPARVLYEWSYSLRPKNEIIDELTHNQLSEEGTMWDKETGRFRETLFEVQYVKPGVYFPQFITFPDITPEGFLHVLISIIKTTRYGAQSNVMDANIRNHIIAIALDQFEPAISSYVLSREWNGDEVTLDSIKQYTVEKLKECSKVVKVDNDTEKPITKLMQLINELLNNESKLKEIYKKLLNDSIAYLIECQVIKENNINNYLGELNIS
ncbi:type I-D CRISPR-associated protein Cas7/Csc2 [Archaeoglobales archaeon]|nr:MAG: type I-D CRISPR-associated protein Cas7/Csc2 [Archaeoglobales archaeon]